MLIYRLYNNWAYLLTFTNWLFCSWLPKYSINWLVLLAEYLDFLVLSAAHRARPRHTDRERFAVASSLNDKTSKKSVVKQHDAPCVFKVLLIPTTPGKMLSVCQDLHTPKTSRHTKSVFMRRVGKTSKKIMAHRVVSPCFSLKFNRLSTTPQQNALGVIRPLRRFCYFYIRKMVISWFDGYLKGQHYLTSVIDLNVLSRAMKVLLHCHLGSLFYSELSN